MNHLKPLRSPQPQLLDSSILFSLVKLFFGSASILLLITDGHERARCSKRTVIGLSPKLYPAKMQHMLEQAKERPASRVVCGYREIN